MTPLGIQICQMLYYFFSIWTSICIYFSIVISQNNKSPNLSKLKNNYVFFSSSYDLML